MNDLFGVHDVGGASLAEALVIALALAEICVGSLDVVDQCSSAVLRHFLNGIADHSGLSQGTRRLIF